MIEIDKIENGFLNNTISYEQKQLLTMYLNRLHSNNVPVIYNLRHLRKLINIHKKEQNRYFGEYRNGLYRTFYIHKKSGGYRKIEAPKEKLGIIQKWIKREIVDKFLVSEYAKGFKKKTNIVDNALPHCNKDVLLNIDIKDFFPSITYDKVFRMFNYMGYTKEVSHLLTRLCTNSDNVLPQGSPASPSISNLVNLRLDKRLSSLANVIGDSYTRYADDITFSGSKGLLKYKELIISIIKEENYEINNKKLRITYNNQRQEVTGLIVNKKVSPNAKIIKELNNAIYYINKYGLQSHMDHENVNKSAYKEHLYGLAYFVNMVDRKKGQQYLSQLDKLIWI